MHITFKSQKLAKTLSSEKTLKRQFKADHAAFIKRRMMVLKAAPTLASVSYLPPERRHQLKGPSKIRFAVDLKHPYRVVFEPNHNPLPLRENGGLDLEKITAITIVAIEDYH